MSTAPTIASDPRKGCLRPQDLCHRLHEIAADRSGHFAVRVQVPHLDGCSGWPWTPLIVEEALTPLTAGGQARLFVLGDADYCLMCDSLPLTSVELALTRLSQMFLDPGISGRDPTADGGILPSWFDLAGDDDFARLVAVAEAARRPSAAVAAADLRPIAAADLPTVTRNLGEGNLGPLMRRQSVLEMATAGAFTPLFDEVFVSIADCQRVFAPGIDLLARPTLFRYLTESLDAGVLAEFVARRSFSFPDQAFSLNLNLATLATPAFARFRAALADHRRVLIELQVADVLADLDGFAAARDRLRGDGFRVVLDGLTLAGLDMLDPSALDADFVKVLFRADDSGADGAARLARLAPALQRIGGQRLIFARVERERIVEDALGLGICRFQGRFVDKLVAAMARKERLRRCHT